MESRTLSRKEIDELEARGCQAGDWSQILVKEPFDIKRFRNVSFSGAVELGAFTAKVKLSSGIEQNCGLYHCQIHNCSIGSNSYLSNVAYLGNYLLEDNVVIENCGPVMVVGMSSFGNGVEIDVLNEGGGRSLKIFDCLSAQMAYFIVFYRHHSALIDKLNEIIDGYTKTRTASRGTIGTGARISGAGRITNVAVGPFAIIDGALTLEEGTVQSSALAPVYIGTGVIAKKFIVLSGSKADQSAILEKCFVGQSVKVGKQFSAENSAFFCNSELFHGEGCSAFAGPYTVSHHKSTLLIAGFFWFYNAGSGSNQSNHMYKLGPVHQGVLERGSKTGSFSYLSWENRVGAFSTVIGKNYANFDTTDLPFSLIRESGGKTVCIPGWTFFTVGVKRDGMKWPGRDGRKDAKRDLIHFQVLSPFVIGKMLRGIQLLNDLAKSASDGQETLNFGGVLIQKKVVNTACECYETAIRMFIGDCLGRKLDELKNCTTLNEVRSALSRTVDNDLVKWVDVNGLMAPESAIAEFVGNVAGGKINDIKSFDDELLKIHAKYDEYEWNWCARLIETRSHISMREMTAATLVSLIEEWKAASDKYNVMVLDDARKEFDVQSKISYGIDGGESVRDADFSAVRGTYDGNSFVKGIKEDSVRVEARAKALIDLIKRLN